MTVSYNENPNDKDKPFYKCFKARSWLIAVVIVLPTALFATWISVVVKHPWPVVFASLLSGLIYILVQIEKRGRSQD